MRQLALLAGLGLAVAACATEPRAPAIDYAAILADPIRPEADRVRDADRKPAELVAFAGVRPGYKVAELAPGGGYFTRVLSGVVGPEGDDRIEVKGEVPARRGDDPRREGEPAVARPEDRAQRGRPPAPDRAAIAPGMVV